MPLFEEVDFKRNVPMDGFELIGIARNASSLSAMTLTTASGFMFAVTAPGSMRVPGPVFSSQDMQMFCDALARAGFRPSTENKPSEPSSALAAQSAHIADLRELLHHAMRLKKPLAKAPQRPRNADEPMSAGAGDF